MAVAMASSKLGWLHEWAEYSRGNERHSPAYLAIAAAHLHTIANLIIVCSIQYVCTDLNLVDQTRVTQQDGRRRTLKVAQRRLTRGRVDATRIAAIEP